MTHAQIVRTIKAMEITYDPAKNARNVQECGLSFDRAIDFDFHTALYRVDDRREYGETRIRAMGTLNGRLHALVFVEQATGIRVISFRKANRREIKRYESSRPSSEV
ncbi:MULTISPECIES: BrnT family toxin [Acidithiobacillus]|uniref:BrnT family toxin n=1 Tax=Acidithiobacillus TaxID=119977 RepID=UPI00192B4360|nr:MULTISPECIES: BrnT family toxin [Acidithiobacillus]MDA8176911.1 BrnT family toxin [Acidithiobacillus sp.]